MKSATLRSLAELGSFKAELKRAAQQARKDEALAQEAAAQAHREQHLFSLSVGKVAPITTSIRIDLTPAPPTPEPQQRRLDEKAALRETLSDDFDVVSLLETDEALSYKRAGVGPDVVQKLRRGTWSIQAQIDLHGMRRDEAREQLGQFLRDAVKHGLRCLRIVHGKGNGSPGREPVLKTKVHNWLAQKQEVIAFVQARGSEGGSGALVVLLQAARG